MRNRWQCIKYSHSHSKRWQRVRCDARDIDAIMRQGNLSRSLPHQSVDDKFLHMDENEVVLEIYICATSARYFNYALLSLPFLNEVCRCDACSQRRSWKQQWFQCLCAPNRTLSIINRWVRTYSDLRKCMRRFGIHIHQIWFCICCITSSSIFYSSNVNQHRNDVNWKRSNEH